MTEIVKWEVRSVLAGAYKGKRINLEAILTHWVGVDANGAEVTVACGRVNLDDICDVYGLTEEQMAQGPTCEKCKSKRAG